MPTSKSSGEAGRGMEDLSYIFVMVKFPEPVQPDCRPVRFQVPEMVLEFITVPFSVNTFVGARGAEGVDVMTNWNPPDTTPFVVPLSVRAPEAVPPFAKQGEEVLKFTLLTLTVPLLFCDRVVVKPAAAVPFALVRLAVQFPLMLLELFVLPPHAASKRGRAIAQTDARCLINSLEILFAKEMRNRDSVLSHAG